MLSLLFKTAPLAGQAPHRLMNEPRNQVTALLSPETSFTFLAYNGVPRLWGAPRDRKSAPKVSGSALQAKTCYFKFVGRPSPSRRPLDS